MQHPHQHLGVMSAHQFLSQHPGYTVFLQLKLIFNCHIGLANGYHSQEAAQNKYVLHSLKTSKVWGKSKLIPEHEKEK